MKTTIITPAIKVIAVISLILGIAQFIQGIDDSSYSGTRSQGDMEITYGIFMIIWSFVIYGFSYIVKAAYIYIQKNEESESKS